MDALEEIEVRGRPIACLAAGIFWMLVVFALAGVILNGGEGRIPDAGPSVIFLLVAALPALWCFRALKLARDTRGVVVLVNSAGVLDRRRGGLVPWGDIKSVTAIVLRRPGVQLEVANGGPTPRRIFIPTSGLRTKPALLGDIIERYRRIATPGEYAEAHDPTVEQLSAMRRQRPFAAFAMIALLGFVFILQAFVWNIPGKTESLAGFSPSLLVIQGGLIRDLVDLGQYWRFLTAPLLHGNLIHLVGNCLGLAIGGSLLERLIGWRWLLATFALAAICGGLGSYLLNGHRVVSVGASGGIVGFFGAALVLAFRFGKGGALRNKLLSAAGRVLVPNLIIALDGRTAIDIAAHTGGAVGGMIAGAVVWFTWKDETTHPDGKILPSVIAGIFVVAVACAFYFAAAWRSTLFSQAPHLSGATSVHIMPKTGG